MEMEFEAKFITVFVKRIETNQPFEMLIRYEYLTHKYYLLRALTIHVYSYKSVFRSI
jgi:hypothetical protein